MIDLLHVIAFKHKNKVKDLPLVACSAVKRWEWIMWGSMFKSEKEEESLPRSNKWLKTGGAYDWCLTVKI